MATGNKSDAECCRRKQCSQIQLQAGDSIFSSIQPQGFKAIASELWLPNPFVQQTRHSAQMALTCKTNHSGNCWSWLWAAGARDSVAPSNCPSMGICTLTYLTGLSSEHTDARKSWGKKTNMPYIKKKAYVPKSWISGDSNTLGILALPYTGNLSSTKELILLFIQTTTSPSANHSPALIHVSQRAALVASENGPLHSI